MERSRSNDLKREESPCIEIDMSRDIVHIRKEAA